MKTSKTHMAALVLIPPEPLWEAIQKIRQRYDTHYRRWMPHITLIYPFLPIHSFATYQEKLMAVCSEIPPFKLGLSQMKYFRHGKNRFTAWLAPQPPEPVANLAERLLNIFPDCNATFRFAAGFTPHLSLGQVRGQDKLKQLWMNCLMIGNPWSGP